MTAVAFKDGIMAADSALFRDYMLAGRVTKIHDLGRAVVGVSGDAGYSSLFITKLRACDLLMYNLDEMPAVPQGGFAAMIAYRDGRLFMFGEGNFYQAEAPFYAIGCVHSFLLGAMAAGASAAAAVDLAIAHTDSARAPVTKVRVW
jgi:hypothetical protein